MSGEFSLLRYSYLLKEFSGSWRIADHESPLLHGERVTEKYNIVNLYITGGTYEADSQKNLYRL